MLSCNAVNDRHRVPAVCRRREYVYLLGMYLGDGYIVADAQRGCIRLRIYLDMRYPGIIDECAEAMRAVMPNNRVDIRQTRPDHNCIQVGAYSRSLPCLFPQHGPGMKHTRRIVLADWQQNLIDQDPRPLIRGLIHSDGCRVINKSMGREYLRYMFSNESHETSATSSRTPAISWASHSSNRAITPSLLRDARAIEILDSFVGPKS